ncbi:MAG TPA: MFS transporter [Candidatus Dormibacteraeota bacterium]|nr:MFS transporter [Candidatus Dormibacteraeota bacterium]
MRRYLTTLAEPDFRKLFLGATASTLGDGMSFVALTWLVVSRPGGTLQLGLLVALYTAPVIVGGWLAGALLDRFDKRYVIAADCTLRGAAFALVPLTQLLGLQLDWLVFAVAALYGLFKMVPLAGFPSVIPDLVIDSNLDTANALEGLSYSVAGVVGPALAGLLIPFIGAGNVMLIDAVSYFAFALLALAVHQALISTASSSPTATGWPQVVRLLVTDLPIVATTLAFMAFNIAEGMLMVTGPWLARVKLGGAAALGLLLSSLSAGELAGSAVAGGLSFKRPLLAIGGVSIIASLGFGLVYFTPVRPLVALGYLVVGFFSAPMTVWAQSIRMRRLPPNVRGRAFAALRTLMQATPPIGAAAAAPLLAGGRFSMTVVAMVLLGAAPAAALLGIGLADGRER